MLDEEVFIMAYEGMKSKHGNMTKGIDGKTLDGFSIENIRKTIQLLREEKYDPLPVRRNYIPKRDGKKRPLGIPIIMDKVIQESMLIILECIYENEKPHFLNCNHGFRKKRGTHTALKEISKWSGTKWFIEGDIQGFFNNIDHHILVNILEKRIQDHRFIRLIWKFLRAGFMDNGVLHSTKLGTPQGGIISPILANLYLHEFDVEVSRWCEEYTKGKERKKSLEWRRLNRKKNSLIKRLNEPGVKQELKVVNSQLDKIPSMMTNDPDFVRVKYVRYADDWLIGVIGPVSLAREIKEKARKFLDERLKLTLHQDKTLITSATQSRAHFLGMLIGRANRKERRVAVVRQSQCKYASKHRSSHSQIIFEVDDTEIIRRLAEDGYCDTKGFPTTRTAFIGMEDFQMVLQYNTVKRGIFNYYKPVSNQSVLDRVDYILRYSLAKTFAAKYKTSIKKVFNQRGMNLRTVRIVTTGEKVYKYWPVKIWDFSNKFSEYKDDPSPTSLDVLLKKYMKLTKSRLGHECCICGTKERVEMHHVRRLRKAGASTVKGFNKVLGMINRKQIPVCKECHTKIHTGKYDGMSLKDLTYIPI
jgi:group II intron reverse transcriptase/maturase